MYMHKIRHTGIGRGPIYICIYIHIIYLYLLECEHLFPNVYIQMLFIKIFYTNI